MRARWIFAAWLATLAAPIASNAEPVTQANWRQHPAIVEIKAIYAEIRQAEAAGRLRKEHREFGYCQPYEDSERTLYLDEDGTVRSYRVGRGSEHSSAQIAYYYDQSGALRFVFANWGVDNGTVKEYRVYLSKAGERLWQERRDVKGPGWTLPDELPDEWLVKSARQAFNGENPCPGEK